MNVTDVKQIICMKWGSLYGAEYVNRLYAMVRYCTQGPIRFVCLTDDVQGIRPEVECLDCPSINLPMPHCLRPWRKVNLFSESAGLFGFSGDWLFLDLDVVITGSMDCFFTYKPQESFVVMQNWTQKGKGIGNTSVYRFRVGADSYILNDLLEDPEGVISQYRNSQTYISKNIKALNFWPEDWCVLFKVQCLPPWPRRFWVAPTCPPTARVVAFPGEPNPHQAVKGRWPVKRWFKRVYKFTKPASWIQEQWDQAESAIK